MKPQHPTQEDLVISTPFCTPFCTNISEKFHPFFPVEPQHGQLKVERVSAAGRASCGARGAAAVGWMSAKVLPKASNESTETKNMEVSNLSKKGMIYSIYLYINLYHIYLL